MRETPTLYAVDLKGCTALRTLTTEAIITSFVESLKKAGATVVQTMSHNFPETGLTCVLILAESHAILHTWPETGAVNLDIFSCSTRLKSLAAIDALSLALGASATTIQEIARADGHLVDPRR